MRYTGQGRRCRSFLTKLRIWRVVRICPIPSARRGRPTTTASGFSPENAGSQGVEKGPAVREGVQADGLQGIGQDAVGIRGGKARAGQPS